MGNLGGSKERLKNRSVVAFTYSASGNESTTHRQKSRLKAEVDPSFFSCDFDELILAAVSVLSKYPSNMGCSAAPVLYCNAIVCRGTTFHCTVVCTSIIQSSLSRFVVCSKKRSIQIKFDCDHARPNPMFLSLHCSSQPKIHPNIRMQKARLFGRTFARINKLGPFAWHCDFKVVLQRHLYVLLTTLKNSVLTNRQQQYIEFTVQSWKGDPSASALGHTREGLVP